MTVFGADTLVTALYGVLDPETRTWSYATAGHYPAVLRRADGTTILLNERAGPPLGCGASYRSIDVQLEAGSTLMLYTDGLVERRNELIDVGLARLVEASRSGPSDPEALCDHILGELLVDHESDDDVALLVFCLT